MKSIVSIIVIALICLTGCYSDAPDTSESETRPAEASPTEITQPETPNQGIQVIIDLYEARDFDTLIRTRYAEIDKAENNEQIQSLVDRLTTLFQNEDKLAEAISTYTSVLEATPELSEDGTVATFTVEERFIKLSKMQNGTWGFHL
jgi:hypothetical protein